MTRMSNEEFAKLIFMYIYIGRIVASVFETGLRFATVHKQPLMCNRRRRRRRQAEEATQRSKAQLDERDLALRLKVRRALPWRFLRLC
jgi:hypothetical protein